MAALIWHLHYFILDEREIVFHYDSLFDNNVHGDKVQQPQTLVDLLGFLKTSTKTL